MQFATDYSTLVDWAYEADIARQDARERRERELIEELQTDRAALEQAWDEKVCDQLTGFEVAQYIRDNDAAGLFAAVSKLVKLGINTIAEERAEKEVGRG